MSRVIEGSWEELAARADELRQYPRLRLEIPSVTENGTDAAAPNHELLEVLQKIRENQADMDFTSTERTDQYIRGARSGAMYGIADGDS